MQMRWLSALATSFILLLVCISFQEEQCTCFDACADGSCGCTNSSGTYQMNCVICNSRTSLNNSEGVIQSHDLNIFEGYTNLSTCSILIQSPINTTIRLYIETFQTECSWDFLHIHDGISPFNPSIAAYGGNLMDNSTKFLKQDSEIVSSTNSIYLVFRPDEFVNHDGFKISYKRDGCKKWCNNHGDCIKGKCNCDDGWQGEWCNIQRCSCLNGGSCVDNVCNCVDGFGGMNCEQDLSKNFWEYVPSSDSSPGKRANFGGSLIDDEYWIFGGYYLGRIDNIATMAKYNVNSKVWTMISPSGPVSRSGHTLTAHNKNLYMFGGQIDYKTTDELWKFDGTQWHQLKPHGNRMSSTGHCSVLINSTIYFMGGIDHTGVVIIDVQMYDIKNDKWTIVSHRNMTRSFYNRYSHRRTPPWHDQRTLYGRFSPSCVYNPVNDRILVFGGLNTTSIRDENAAFWILSEEELIRQSTFIEYDVHLHHWSNMYVADINSVPMLYMSAIQIVDRNLVVFGGRHVNIGHNTKQSQCFSVQPYIVNIETGEGRVITSFTKLWDVGPVRMGLGSFVHKNDVYFVGGYNGKLHDDVIVYHIKRCEDQKNKIQCIQKREDYTLCLWNERNSTCTTKPISKCGTRKCPLSRCPSGDGFDKRCVGCTDDPSCVWDQQYPDTCRAGDSVNITTNVAGYHCRDVPKPSRIRCSEYKRCEHCKEDCYWNLWGVPRCSVNIDHIQKEVICEDIQKPCNQLNSCDKCISSGGCMWCQLNTLNTNLDGGRLGQCLDTTTYYALFPFGQCVQWHMGNTPDSKCPKKSCQHYGNCTLCQQQPECGWCDDGTGTGSGYCLPGTYHGALTAPDHVYTIEDSTCPADSWYYDTCPKCQCNGHSRCTDRVNCDICSNNTAGIHCDECVAGYHGDATNNGQCRKCNCPRHSDKPCNTYSGYCSCNTRGIAGSKCDKCYSDFRGDPIADTCYSILQVGTTFVPSALGGRTKANFVLDLDDSVTSDVQITVNAHLSSFKVLLVAIGDSIANLTHEYEQSVMDPWTVHLKKSKLKWDKSDVEIRLYITFPKSKDRLEMGITVRKHVDEIDLKQFFVIFFACVVILLLIFLLAWTAKIRYSQYRNQRDQEIQLVERAARPFKSHKMLFKDDNEAVVGSIFEVRPIALEPLKEEKYGIVSYIVSLPGPREINLAIGSGSFVTAMSYSKVISNPNINFDSYET